MAERGLGLGPVSFAPLAPDGPPRIRRADLVWSDPPFQLAPGTLDRSLQTDSAWSKTASATIHVVVIALLVALLPAVGVIAMPDVPEAHPGLRGAHAIAPPPPPPPPAEPLTEEPTQPSEPSPPVDEPVFTASITASHGVMPETGLVASVPVRAGLGVPGGVGWGGYAGGTLGGLPVAPKPAPQTPAHPQEPIRIDGRIPQPTLTRRVDPIYPDIAVRARLGGMVIIEATVDRKGWPQSLTVLRSQGPLLDRAALDAVEQWRYEPLRYHGEAVLFILAVTISFAIE
jgi:protein TonB